MSSNIPAGPSYGIYISQLVRVGRICNTYDEFAKRNMTITTKLIKQGFRYWSEKFYMKYIHLMDRYNVGHIYDGICGLYVGHPSLFRQVTTRRQRL